MELDEFRELVTVSNPTDWAVVDWTKTFSRFDDNGKPRFFECLAVSKHDIDISLAWGDYDFDNRFQEPWTMEFAVPYGLGITVAARYRGSVIFTEQAAWVDDTKNLFLIPNYDETSDKFFYSRNRVPFATLMFGINAREGNYFEYAVQKANIEIR